MNREEILAKSRKENQEGDEYELAAYNQGWQYAAKIGILVCAILFTLETFWGDGNASGYWAVYCAIYGSCHFVVYRKTRKKSCLTFSLIFLLCMTVFLVLYLARLVGWL